MTCPKAVIGVAQMSPRAANERVMTFFSWVVFMFKFLPEFDGFKGLPAAEDSAGTNWTRFPFLSISDPLQVFLLMG